MFSSFASTQPTTPYSTFNPNANETDEERRIRVNNMTFGGTQFGGYDTGGGMGGGMGGYSGGFNPMMGGGIGAFGGRGFMGYR